MNERFLEVNKSKILANLFLAHINDKYGWDDYQVLSYCLERLNLAALPFLDAMAKKPEQFYVGFLQFDTYAAFLISAGIAQSWGTHFQVMPYGMYLYHYGIKGDIDYEFPKKPEEDDKASQNGKNQGG